MWICQIMLIRSAECPGKKNWGRGRLIVCGILMELAYDAGSDVEIRRWCLIHNFLIAFQPAWIKLQCFFWWTSHRFMESGISMLPTIYSVCSYKNFLSWWCPSFSFPFTEVMLTVSNTSDIFRCMSSFSNTKICSLEWLKSHQHHIDNFTSHNDLLPCVPCWYWFYYINVYEFLPLFHLDGFLYMAIWFCRGL